MSSESPVSILFSSDGYELNVANNSTTSSSNKGLLIAGTDGTNTRFISTDSSGREVVVGSGVAGTPAGGVLSVQGVTSGTAVTIGNNSVIDSGNSTTTPLAANGTFTGTAIDLLGYTQISIFVYSNVASATGGLNLQFSTNGTNWDEDQAVTVSANKAEHVSISAISRYFRIVYVNGGTLQTTFRLQTILKSISSSGTVGNIESLPVSGDSTLRTQSLIIGKTTGGGGNYVSVKVNPSGSLAADVTGSTVGLVAGVASIGTVGLNAGTNAIGSITNTSFVVTQSTASSLKAQVIGAGSAGTADTGVVTIQGISGMVAVKVDGSGVTQPVSGTITANAGTGNFTVVGSGTAGTPTGGVLTVQGSASGTAIPVSGTVTANAGTGSFTVAQSTASSLNATVVQGTAANLRSQTASEASTGATVPTVAGLAGGSVTTAAPTYVTGNMSALSLTTSGLLRVDGSNVTQPISGSVSLNSGTNAIGSITNTSFAVTQSTASSLNATIVGLGTAGTPSGGVLTVQGSASGTAIPVSGTVTANAGTGNFTVIQSTAASLRSQTASEASTGAAVPTVAGLAGGSVTTAAPTYVTGNIGALSLTTSGLLRVDGSNVTQPISGTVTANAGTGSFTVAQSTATQLNATVIGTVTANIGTSGSLALDATLTGGSQRTKITDGTNNASVKAASTAAVAGDFPLVVALHPSSPIPTGTNSIGSITNTSFAVTQSTAASLNATIIGNTNAGSGASTGLVTVQGNASGTPMPTTFSGVDATNSAVATLFQPVSTNTHALSYSNGINIQDIVVKNSAGNLYTLWGINNSTSVRYIQIFDVLGIPSNGTALTIAPIVVAPGGSFSLDLASHGLYFSAGLYICTSSTLATKTLGSSDMSITVGYK